MKSLIALLSLLWLCFGLIVINNIDIRLSSSRLILGENKSIPDNVYVLVPGAGRNFAFARPNYSYLGRMDAVAELWKTHHGIKIILSGKADGMLYNEAVDMQFSLRHRGVPGESLILDENSITTYDSVKGYKTKYGNKKVVIVSQREHLERALWIAQNLGVHASGYVAGGFPGETPAWFIWREYAARIKARLLSFILSS